MPNSTSNSQKTMQNQSTSHAKENIKNKFVDKTEFTAAHVSPYGRLWVDHPFIETDWMHAHNHLEIGRCVKGSGTFNVDDKVLRVQAPCYSILYEGEWHSAQTNPYDQCEWNYLYIDLNYFLSRSSDDVLTFYPFRLAKLRLPHHYAKIGISRDIRAYRPDILRGVKPERKHRRRVDGAYRRARHDAPPHHARG